MTRTCRCSVSVAIDRSRARRRARAPARAPDRRAARVRRPGPDAHRHRRVGDRAQRLPYAGGGGRVRASRASAAAAARDRSPTGPGIADLDEMLDGRYRSRDGHGPRHRRRAPADGRFDVDSSSPRHDGRSAKLLPRGAPPPTAADGRRDRIAPRLAERPTEPSRRCSSRTRSCSQRSTSCASARTSCALNRELEDTNRGVVALYAELDEKADHLRRADEIKSRFLSNMSHEFRTPLNSILALTPLLLDRADGRSRRAGAAGALHPQGGRDALRAGRTTCSTSPRSRRARSRSGRRVRGREPVRRAARHAAAAAGERVGRARVRGADGLPPPLYTDEAKVSQILRNFISNERRARRRGTAIAFAVADTGIGIPPRTRRGSSTSSRRSSSRPARPGRVGGCNW